MDYPLKTLRRRGIFGIHDKRKNFLSLMLESQAVMVTYL